MRPEISVLLPVRDAASTLAAAIRSIQAQHFGNFELLVLDDGSTDGSLELATSLAAGAQRIIPVPLPPRGIAATLNSGLELARGKYIARMDADDLCHPLRLGLQARFLETHPRVGLVSCLVGFGGDRSQAGGYARHVDFVNSLVSHRDMALHRFRESPLAHPSVLFRRELPQDFGGYAEGPFPEDYELWLRWFEAGLRFAKVRQELLVWNDSPGRLSRVHPNYEVERFHRIKAGYLARHLFRINPFHPEVILFGAGRESRKRAGLLQEHSIKISAYLDLDPRKVGNRINGCPVLHRDSLPAPGAAFGLSFLAGHGAAEALARYLASRGWVMGRHFLLAA